MEVTNALAAGANSSTNANTTTTRANDSSVISSDFETFLKMLTTQLENQDPLNPVTSEEFAVQLATFSSVEQQVQTNNLLESLTSQLGLNGISQYADWVGMEARAPVNAEFSGQPLTLYGKPETSAESAELVIKTASGAVVQRLPLSTSGETLEWNGVLDNGNVAAHGTYSFEVDSFVKGVKSATTPAEVYVPVTEVKLDGTSAKLVTQGGDEVLASSVTAIRNPNDG